MKLWRKLFLVLSVLVIVSQIPFIFRRYKMGRLHDAIQKVNSQRAGVNADDKLAEYKGVVHVHSFLGGHSTGGFQEIIAAAKSNQLNFVVMTEHPSQDLDTSEMTLKGWHGGVLFINGNEVSTADGDRLLLIPGTAIANVAGSLSTQEVLTRQKDTGGLAFVAYPQQFKGWHGAGYEGLEVYNIFSNTSRLNPFTMFFDGLWCYRSYPELLFARFYERPTQNLQKWDIEMAAGSKKLVAISGNDAHANIGLTLNDAAGNRLLGFKLDAYERSFRLVRLHVLTPRDAPLDSSSLLRAVAAGHCFIGFDLFGDTSGFRFTAATAGAAAMQGDEIRLDGEVRLSVNTPVATRVVLLRNGSLIQDLTGVTSKDFLVKELGTYRVEVYLPQLTKPAGEQPWIISNPIYVR